jgi:hypothetical protein
MSETPTEQPAKSGGFHLPVLPEGWFYGVRLSGPDGQSITVAHQYNGSVTVGVVTGLARGEQQLKSFEVESLAKGVQQGAKLTRTLKDLAEHEQKSRTAREALLSQIGQSAEDPLPDNAASSGTITVDLPEAAERSRL